MEALVVRLSQLDSEAEGAIRVVMFYDTLIRRRVDLAALARASAGLAECVAGIRLDGTGQTFRVAPDGPAPPAGHASTTVAITLDDEQIGAVWLERPSPLPLDRLLLDRLAIAAAAVVERYGPARTTMADPALVELAISPGTDDAARARALRLLGFGADAVDPAGAAVRVVAVRSPLPLDQLGALVSPGRPVKAAPLGEVGVLLLTAVDASRFPPDVRAGIGSPGPLPRSWLSARTALRFTTPRQPVVDYCSLGALALLAHVPGDAARDNTDVAALAGLAADDLNTLDAYCSTGSVRRAADVLHLHHSSVARRLDQLGKTLGYSLVSPTGPARAQLALTAWRLLEA